MKNILWLDYLFFFLSIMPGAGIPYVKKIFKYQTMGRLYLEILFVIQLAYSIIFQRYEVVGIYLCMLGGVIFPIILEKNIVGKSRDLSFIVNTISKYKSIFLFPVLEEINFRWLLFNAGKDVHQTFIDFIIISSLAFGISHYPYLGKKGLVKTFQGTLLSLLFIKYGLLMVILCHLMFNMFVFTDANKRKKNNFY
ncbi:CPBP family intramembrane glutamic endopeptidase [Limosilactobacillus allomucosae]|uniref:CPBP family intramembrane glutamic endopeptidase n=1 Tax=Limosilactobacillus allomucosae TaxID=3142938 RepID=A0ABV0I500_9LACO